MSDNDIFGELDERTKDASGGGDYADWWEPENPGEQLIGVVVELHSAPQEWTEPGEVPETIYTVMSVGRGDLKAGQAATPKQHKQLKQGLEGASIGDLVKLEFTGYEKVEGRGQPMNTYKVGVIPRDEWEVLDGADDIQEMLDEYDGVEGDNRQTEPYTSGSSGSSSSGGSSGGAQADDSEVGQAASALQELMDIQGGAVDVEKAQKILTDIRGFDVDVEEAAMVAGLEVEDGEISR